MPRIIDIDALMPDDVELRWRKQSWLLPGDLSTERIIAIQKAAQALEGAATSKDGETTITALQTLANHIAAVLAIRQPERAQDLEFGVKEIGMLAGAIVAAMSGGGLTEEKQQAEPQGNGPTAAGN